MTDNCINCPCAHYEIGRDAWEGRTHVVRCQHVRIVADNRGVPPILYEKAWIAGLLDAIIVPLEDCPLNRKEPS